MTTEAQREWQEHVETLRNDARLRQQQQGTTLSQFAEAFLNEERQGRFQTIDKTTHTAATPVYPEQPENSPFHVDLVGQEPPLGFSVDQMEPVGTQREIEASLARLGATGDFPSGEPDGGAVEEPALASAPDAVESAAPSTSNTDNSNDEPPEAA